MKHKGLFITFEGMDGAGKSVVSREVGNILTSLGYDVVMTREPGGTPVAEDIRNLVLSKHEEPIIPEAEMMLMAAARTQHYYNKVKPLVESGKIVISDRWLSSSLAYQGAGRHIPIEIVKECNDFGIHGARPDMEFIIDTPLETCISRIESRGNKDRMEDETKQFYNDVYQFFHSYSTPYLIRVSGEDTINNIATNIVDKIIGHIT